MFENPITSTPALGRLSIGGSSSTSSSIRRRSSLIPRKTLGRDERRAVASSTPVSPRASRDTISSSPQKEHYQGCLKLYAENVSSFTTSYILIVFGPARMQAGVFFLPLMDETENKEVFNLESITSKITKDNAWNLQLIDFMTSMLRRHDSRMDNLQTASTVVDASARIYSFRVDAVHYDVLKMAGGLSKAAQEAAVDADGNLAPVARKKKKRSKGAVAANPEVFNGDFDTNDFIGFFPNFSNDRVNNWVEENRLNLSQQALAFDVNAEVEPIPRDEAHNDLYDDEPLGGIESEEETDVAVAACDGDEWGNEDAAAAGELHDQAKGAEEDIGEMLEPPTKVAKIFIPYAMRAKKVDMKLLKITTWKMLTEGSEADKPKVAETSFQTVYSQLPSKLSSSMRESLSVPLALLSILHLANEKGLILENHEDLKDFGILGLIDKGNDIL
ncbi:Barren-like protein [Operophtera brumata]|uniref:Condensin complex subunit 2 n=1 Tax=Operophtera brumata TaxID=104452 RepID=A0A0L7L599_OPEBR|nr:Barren-like protein [Operophtera brumata]